MDGDLRRRFVDLAKVVGRERDVDRAEVDVVVAFSNVRFGGCDVSRLSLVGGTQVNTVDLVRPVRHISRRMSSAGQSRVLLRGDEIRATSPEDS